MVVDGRALARAPGHGDDAVAGFFAAVELAAGVVVGHRFVHAGRKGHGAGADEFGKAIADAIGGLALAVAGHGAIDHREQLVTAGEIEGLHGGTVCRERETSLPASPGGGLRAVNRGPRATSRGRCGRSGRPPVRSGCGG